MPKAKIYEKLAEMLRKQRAWKRLVKRLKAKEKSRKPAKLSNYGG
jgi:hypothetical protein